jgi:hypothetical protein
LTRQAIFEEDTWGKPLQIRAVPATTNTNKALSCFSYSHMSSALPFRIHVSDEELQYLRQRIESARYPDQLTNIAAWEDGTDLTYFKVCKPTCIRCSMDIKSDCKCAILSLCGAGTRQLDYSQSMGVLMLHIDQASGASKGAFLGVVAVASSSRISISRNSSV